MSTKRSFPLSVQLTIITLARFVLNTGLRMVYPFAPALSRGLGVPITAVYRLITLRNLAGFLSPLFSPLSERFGRRPILVGSMLLFGVGCGLVFLLPAYWPLGVALALIAIAKTIYDPAMQAYVGDVVPYKQRGRAIAITELSWAGGLLLGAPAVGFIITRQGWQAPFVWLNVLGVITAVLLWRILPQTDGNHNRRTTLREIAVVIRQFPVIWTAAFYILLVMAGNEIIFIVYGDWMESSFSLSLTNLGVASGVIGGAEVTGELFAGWAVDRFGKRPVIIATGMLNALVYALIPFSSGGLLPALATLFFLFLFFEITVVGGVPLMTELVPKARSVVMAMVLAFGAMGRAIGSFIGPILWDFGGFLTNGLISAGMMGIAVLILARWIREAKDEANSF